MKSDLTFTDKTTEKAYLKYNYNKRKRVLLMQRGAFGIFSFSGVFHLVFLQPKGAEISQSNERYIIVAVIGMVLSILLGATSKFRHKDWIVLLTNLLINYILIEPNFLVISELRELSKMEYFWLGFRISSINLITLICYSSFIYKILQVNATIIFLMIRLRASATVHNIIVDSILGILICVFFYNQEKGERMTYYELYGISLQRESWKKFLNFLPEGIVIFSEGYKCLFTNENLKNIFQVFQEEDLTRTIFKLTMMSTETQNGHPNATDQRDLVFSDFYSRFREKKLGKISREIKTNFCLENLFEAGNERQDDVFFSEHCGRYLCLKLTHIDFDDMDSTLVLVSDISQTIKSHVLEENKKYRDMLFASFSHEIRTPLNCILLMLGRLIKEPSKVPESILKTCIFPSFYSGQILFNLVNDILDYSLLLRGDLKLKIKSIDIKSECLEILEVISMQAHSKGIKLILKLHKNLPFEIRTDASRLKQTLCHLLLNALKYTSKGKITLRVKGPKNQENGIEVCVKDTGMGMSLDEQTRLKDVLRLTSLSTIKVSDHTAGASLKTLLTQSLALALGFEGGGGIRFTSNPTRGSKFFFLMQNHADFVDESSLDFPNEDKESFRFDEVQQSGIIVKWYSDKPSEGRKSNNSKSFTETTEEIISPRLRLKTKNLSSLFFMEEEIRKIKTEMEINPITISERAECRSPIRHFERLVHKSSRVPEKGRPDEPELQPETIQASLKSINENVHCTHPEILVVDDDEFNILAVQTILQKKRFSIAIARNGLEAISLIHKEASARENCCRKFQLILMDVNMPVMGGLEASKILKGEMAENKLPCMPIVGCTAFVGSQDETICRQHGMDGYESKPLNDRKLMHLLNKWTSHKL